MWGLLLVEGCIKNNECSVNNQFSSLIITSFFSFFLAFSLSEHFPLPLPLIIPLSSLPVPSLCPWRELMLILSWFLPLLLLLLLPLILCHHLRFTPPFSLLTGSRRQPCLVLDEWELSRAVCVWMCYQFCVQKRMWRGVYMCECKTSIHLCSRFSERVCVYCKSFVYRQPCGTSILREWLYLVRERDELRGITVTMSRGQHGRAVIISFCRPSLFSPPSFSLPLSSRVFA